MKTISELRLQTTYGRLATIVAIVALLLSAFMVQFFVAYASNPSDNGQHDEKVTICHATRSNSNPYTEVPADESADVGGHDGHNGPIWFPDIQEKWGDIIPPFDYQGSTTTEHYAGKNWDAIGQAIWNNDCKVSGKITLQKHFVNAPDGVNTKSFTFTASGTEIYSGLHHTLVPGTYTIVETPNNGVPTDYVATFGGDCTASGTITIGIGDHKTCDLTNDYTPVPPPTPTSTVTMCKTDDQRQPLAGWQLVLLGSSVATTTVNPDGTTYSTGDVSPGNYVIKADGTYIYRSGGYPADAAFSKRASTDPGYGTWPYSPWRISNPLNQYLGLQVDGDNHIWGPVFASSTHTYYTPFTQTSTSSINYAITDDHYGDNSGNLTATVYKGYTASTTQNGCVTFDNVPYGTYTAAELQQPGWSNVSGLGDVKVNQPTQTITVVNHNDSPPPATYQCSDGMLFLDTETDLPHSILNTVDESTGSSTHFADYGPTLFPVVAVDASGTVYSIDKNTGDLITLDNAAGDTTVVGSTGLAAQKPVAMEFSPDGELYVLTENNNSLYTIDPTTGAATLLTTFQTKIVAGGDIVFSGYDTNPQLVYVAIGGTVYGIDPSTYAVTNLGSLGVGNVTSAAYYNGTYYAYTRDDKFAPFTLDPFTAGTVIDNTGPFAYGDGTACPVAPTPKPVLCSVDIVSDASTTVVEDGDTAASVIFPYNAGWTASIPGANWIWGSHQVAATSSTITNTFDRYFGWHGSITSATLTVASDNTHAETLNGMATSSDMTEFNYKAGNEDQYDVTSAIQQGGNHLQFVVGNMPVANSTWNSNPAGLLYKLHIEGTTTPGTTCLVPYVPPVLGCMDANANNYNPQATQDDGSCTYDPVPGCTDRSATNYDPNATQDDGSCTYPVSCTPGVNLLQNPSFEQPALTSAWSLVNPVDWTVLDNSDSPAQMELQKSVNPLWHPTDGLQYTELAAATQVHISQTIPTVPGDKYTLKWDFGPRPGTEQTDNQLSVKVDGAQVATNDGSGMASTSIVWQKDNTYSFTAAGTSTKVTFAGVGSSPNLGTFLDNTSLTCEPAPGLSNAYCGDGKVNQTWEQCDGGEGCTDYCTYTDQCVDLHLAKVTLDQAPASATFNGQIYVGTSTSYIPSGTWFNLDTTDVLSPATIAKDTNGLGIQRTTGGLTMAAYQTGEPTKFNYEFGTITFLNASPLSFDRAPIPGWPLENSGTYKDIWQPQPLSTTTVDFQWYQTTGSDAASVTYATSSPICEDDGGGNPEQETLYQIRGHVFHDLNDDGIFDETNDGNPRIRIESPLHHWMVKISNGSTTMSTTTDDNGHYSFLVPAGTWTITEVLQGGWKQTNGPHFTVTVPTPVAMRTGLLHTILNYLLPTAYAAGVTPNIVAVERDFNFGNEQFAGVGSSGSGGGYVQLPSSGPVPQVLGASTTAPSGQVSVIPVGAPNAGAGGMAPIGVYVMPLDRVTRRFKTHA